MSPINIKNLLFEEKYGCTSPFIPSRFRVGRRLCQNVTKGKLINDFLEKSVALTGLGM